MSKMLGKTKNSRKVAKSREGLSKSSKQQKAS